MTSSDKGRASPGTTADNLVSVTPENNTCRSTGRHRIDKLSNPGNLSDYAIMKGRHFKTLEYPYRYKRRDPIMACRSVGKQVYRNIALVKHRKNADEIRRLRCERSIAFSLEDIKYFENSTIYLALAEKPLNRMALMMKES